ncbi:DUF1534 domain-containing protein [Pseudomonas syringae]|nr:DUF1534 domain-containing protein [Pseudomonas syringae]MCF5740105.1 DUF1534 domain-containing protein [Pseudomonas syringae]MCF5750041.1 DUF1534 domain-containing protein [Pseudomonas syringae]MCF5755451.1 DUF1534 domain-containing protein [Pseudomonas syringae]RMM56951.1 hypothetical protein ALQ76_102745 [Pseudomonas syringae pv. atrofaciens]
MRLSFRTLQRGNAVRDALRRKEDAERLERRIQARSDAPTAHTKHMKHPSFCHHCAVSLVMQGLQRIDQFLTTGEPEQAIYLGS